MRLLGYSVVARVLLWYPGWLLMCCYVVAKVPRVVARVLLCGYLGTRGWLLGCC